LVGQRRVPAPRRARRVRVERGRESTLTVVGGCLWSPAGLAPATAFNRWSTRRSVPSFQRRLHLFTIYCSVSPPTHRPLLLLPVAVAVSATSMGQRWYTGGRGPFSVLLFFFTVLGAALVAVPYFTPPSSLPTARNLTDQDIK